MGAAGSLAIRWITVPGASRVTWRRSSMRSAARVRSPLSITTGGVSSSALTACRARLAGLEGG